MRSTIRSSPRDFRSYARAELHGRRLVRHSCSARTGRGRPTFSKRSACCRRAGDCADRPLAEVGRRLPGEDVGRPWAVSALIAGDEGETRIGTGAEVAGASRRAVRIDGEPAPPGRMADHVRPLWLTPAQDRLFLDPASERRRFFDRLVFAAYPAHAANVLAYERALRERSRSAGGRELRRRLAVGAGDPDGRGRGQSDGGRPDDGLSTKLMIEESLDAKRRRLPPRRHRVVRPMGKLGIVAEPAWRPRSNRACAAALAASRPRDRAAGRALEGPHRGDLVVRHHAKDRPAAECSTGEQKALILNLVLAQAARLSRVKSAPTPIVLLDEVAAHLDADRRAALFDEIEALGVQAFLTGTDQALFATLEGRALGVHVDAGALTVTDA